MIIIHNTQSNNTVSRREYLAVNEVWKCIGLI